MHDRRTEKPVANMPKRAGTQSRKVADCTEGQVQELFSEGEATEADDKNGHTNGGL